MCKSTITIILFISCLTGCTNKTINANPPPSVLPIAKDNKADGSAFYDRHVDKHPFTVFMKEGGWCWFQDPRAVASNGMLLIGSVKGNGRGEARVGIYNLKTKESLGSAIMHSSFGRDDHNSPVFYVRPDERILSVYAKHHQNGLHYSRISAPNNPLKWSKERRHERTTLNLKDKVTYTNLLNMTNEGKLYLFYRGISFNPTFVTSSDHGDSWSQPIHFFASEVPGRHRPYARYAGNEKGTVSVSITDAHPRDFGNNIYHFEFREGAFYKADGTFIKELATDGPLRPSEAERIYNGSMTTEKPSAYNSVPGAAWTSSIALNKNEHPHIAYSVYLSNHDHRYRISSWDGKKWFDREVAYAGKYLYPHESSYTGLITLDPVDPSIVFISTDVHPSTGKNTGGTHEIYRAQIKSSDDIHSIKWEAVTKNSPVRNIRPIVVHDGDRRIILWNRGDFRSFTNYQLDTVGFIENIN